MPTETRIRIKRNPYQGYEVWLWGNGELTRRSFDNSIDLSSKLAADCVSDQDIEAACDLFERLEWEEPEYPLGVSYRPPVAEAACDAPYDEPIYPPGTMGYEMQQFRPSSPLWDWAAATLRVGAVTAPWVLLVIFCRWVGVL